MGSWVYDVRLCIAFMVKMMFYCCPSLSGDVLSMSCNATTHLSAYYDGFLNGKRSLSSF